MISNSRRFGFSDWLFSALLAANFLAVVPCLAQDSPAGTPAPTGPQTDVETPGNPPATTPEQEAQTTGTEDATGYDQGFFGLDLYTGRSNLPGQRQFSDGFWIGYGPAYPSNAYLRWVTGKGAEAKVSIGTGDLYRGPNSLVRQPNEAWYQKPLGNAKITLGKYYVPFALQEWQYESKWGGMIQSSFGATDVSASLNYDRTTDRPNFYSRLGHNLGPNLNVGVSLGVGRGISFGTPQDKAFGLDLTAKWRGFQFISEAVDIRRRSADRFGFIFGKLSYENLGKWKPFLSRDTWNDRSGNYGSFHSTTAGLDVQLSSTLAVQAAYAHTSQPSRQNISWIQLHWTPQWKYFDERKERGIGRLAPANK